MMTPFFEFMDRYDPTFRHRVRGVGDREIAELEGVYGRPLPESYRALLRFMGADLGGFALSFKAVSAFHNILEDAKSRQADAIFQDTLRDYVIVALGKLNEGDLALLDNVPGEPRVVRVDVEVLRTESTSLLNHMMSAAYLKHPMQRHPLRRFWAGRTRPDRSEAIDVLRGLGFEPLWFSDAYIFVAERGDAQLMLHQQAPDLMSLHVRAPTTAILDEIDAVVGRELDLSTSRVHVLPG